MIATVCGDTNLWKPSSKVPLCAIAVQNILSSVIKANDLPEGLFSLVVTEQKLSPSASVNLSLNSVATMPLS